MLERRVLLLSDPRQCGKTTLAAWSGKCMDLSAIGSELSILRPTVERVYPWTKTDYARVGRQSRLGTSGSTARATRPRRRYSISWKEGQNMNELAPRKAGGEFLLYQTEDGQVRLDVRLQDETVSLTQKLMADLFQVTVPTINEHIKNIFHERELIPEATIKKFLTVRREGNRDVRRELDYFNLDMIISVGYRVKSLIATRFRIWATQRLKEYIVKGFVQQRA